VRQEAEEEEAEEEEGDDEEEAKEPPAIGAPTTHARAFRACFGSVVREVYSTSRDVGDRVTCVAAASTQSRNTTGFQGGAL
jgi:hypothetical protein